MAMAKREQFPSEKLDQYMLRFPDGMRDRLKEAAAENKRSMNAEIIARLEESFPDPDRYERFQLQALKAEKQGVESQFEYLKERMAFMEEQIKLLRERFPDEP